MRMSTMATSSKSAQQGKGRCEVSGGDGGGETRAAEKREGGGGKGEKMEEVWISACKRRRMDL